MKRYLPLLVLISSGAIAQSEALVFLATSEGGEALYVDRASLTTVPPQNLRRFPAVRMWAVNQVPGGRRTPARTERFQFSFNCVARTSMVLSYLNNRPGIRLQDWRAADVAHRYEAPKPGSLQDMAMAFACSGGQLPVAPTTNTPVGPEDGDDLDNPRQQN
jgi:hypothetical protein